MVVDHTEGACSFKTNIAALPGSLDPWRQASHRKPLIDMPAGNAEAAGNLVSRHAFGDKRCIRVDFIHRIHANAMDVLDQRDFPARLGCDHVAGDRKIPCDRPCLGQVLQRQKPAAACIDLEPAVCVGNNTEILQQTAGGDRGGQRVDIRLAALAAHIAWARDQLVERDQLNGLRFGRHGMAPVSIPGSKMRGRGRLRDPSRHRRPRSAALKGEERSVP
jgi:hypothetical protein